MSRWSAEGRRDLHAFIGDVRGLPRAAWVVYAGTFINRFGSFLVTFLVLILVRRGLTPAQAGMAAAAYGLGGLGAAALGGHLADRIGRRRTIALSMFASAATLVALWRVQAIAATVALTALAGVAAEMYRPAASALLADVTPVGRRVGTYALYRTAVNAGFALGPASIGYFAERSSAVVFLGDAATSLLYGVLVLTAIPAAADHAVTREAAARRAAAGAPSGLGMLGRDRVLQVVLATALLVGFIQCQSMSTFPLEVSARGWSMQRFGMLVSLNGLTCVLLELPLAAWTSRLQAWIPMALGATLTGVGMGAIGLAPTAVAMAACVVVWTLGEICYSPVAGAFVADLAPRGMQGRYQASYSLTTSAALMLAPALGPALFTRSRTALWLLCAAMGLLAALSFTLVGRRRTRTAAAELAALPQPAD